MCIRRPSNLRCNCPVQGVEEAEQIIDVDDGEAIEIESSVIISAVRQQANAYWKRRLVRTTAADKADGAGSLKSQNAADAPLCLPAAWCCPPQIRSSPATTSLKMR